MTPNKAFHLTAGLASARASAGECRRCTPRGISAAWSALGGADELALVLRDPIHGSEKDPASREGRRGTDPPSRITGTCGGVIRSCIHI